MMVNDPNRTRASQNTIRGSDTYNDTLIPDNNAVNVEEDLNKIRSQILRLMGDCYANWYDPINTSLSAFCNGNEIVNALCNATITLCESVLPGSIPNITEVNTAISNAISAHNVLTGVHGVNEIQDGSKAIALPRMENSIGVVTDPYFLITNPSSDFIFVGNPFNLAEQVVFVYEQNTNHLIPGLSVLDITTDQAGTNSVVGTSYNNGPLYIQFNIPPGVPVTIKYGIKSKLSDLPEEVLLNIGAILGTVDANLQTAIEDIKDIALNTPIPANQKLPALRADIDGLTITLNNLISQVSMDLAESLIEIDQRFSDVNNSIVFLMGATAQNSIDIAALQVAPDIVEDIRHHFEEFEEDFLEFKSAFNAWPESAITIILDHVYRTDNPHQVTPCQFDPNQIISRINQANTRIRKEVLDSDLVTSDTVRCIIADEFNNFTEENINHRNIRNTGTYTHEDIDDHIDDPSRHFLQSEINHNNLQNIGTLTHAQLEVLIDNLQEDYSCFFDNIQNLSIKSDLNEFLLRNSVSNIYELGIGNGINVCFPSPLTFTETSRLVVQAEITDNDSPVTGCNRYETRFFDVLLDGVISDPLNQVNYNTTNNWFEFTNSPGSIPLNGSRVRLIVFENAIEVGRPIEDRIDNLEDLNDDLAEQILEARTVMVQLEEKIEEINEEIISYGDKNFVHNQNIASATWNIFHGLGKFPSVEVVDSGGTVVIGDVQMIDVNNVKIDFSAPFTGKAYIN